MAEPLKVTEEQGRNLGKLHTEMVVLTAISEMIREDLGWLQQHLQMMVQQTQSVMASLEQKMRPKEEDLASAATRIAELQSAMKNLKGQILAAHGVPDADSDKYDFDPVTQVLTHRG